MFYYCDPLTKMCVTTSTAPLIAGKFQEVIFPELTADVRALRFESKDGDLIMVIDEDTLNSIQFEDAKEHNLLQAGMVIEKFRGDILHGNVGVAEEAALLLPEWEAYRYTLSNTTSGDFPELPLISLDGDNV